MTTFEEIIEGKKAVTAPQQGVVNARVAGGQVAPQPVTTQPVAQSKGDQANARVVGGQASAPAETTKVDNFDLANWLTMGLAGAAQKAQDEKDNVPQLSYQEQIEKLYGDTVDSPEERERKRKLQRNKAIIAAIGDGIGAIANMYYAGKSGINAFDPKTSISKAVREPYDKYLEEQKKYADRLRELRLKGYELDVKADAERRKEKKEAEIRKQNQDNIDRTYEAGRADAAQNQKNWEDSFNADREYKAAAQKLKETELAQKKYIADLNAQIRKELSIDKSKDNAIKTAKGLYGKRTVHGIGGYPIYDNVWNGGWPEVFNTLINNNAGIKETESESTYRRRMGNMSDKAKQEFVDGYYKDYPEAVALMVQMAADTPERYVDSIIAGEDDYSQYAVGGDEYSQYVIE